MFNSCDEEKVVLVHLVLETSANIFFQAAYPIMQRYEHGKNYFREHSEADEKHQNMGDKFLQELSPPMYKRLMEIQFQGWNMLLAVCDRIAILSQNNLITTIS